MTKRAKDTIAWAIISKNDGVIWEIFLAGTKEEVIKEIEKDSILNFTDGRLVKVKITQV